MKLKTLLESKASLLQAQQHMLDFLDDQAWDISIEGSELRFAHPDFGGNVIFGPMEYSDIKSNTRDEQIAEALDYYRDNGMKPLWAQCQQVRTANILVCFKTLNEAIDAALAYDGACIEDLDQESVAENLAFYINDGIIAPSEV
jgi:hypothetical protein